MALILAISFTNLNIIPTNSPLYDDVIWGFAVPLAIPLLLLQCNIKKIWKETGRLLIIFLIGAIGFFRKYFKHPHIDEVENSTDSASSEIAAAAYWSKKEISLKDIAINFAYASIVVTISRLLAENLGELIPTGNIMLNICNTFLGSQYIWITTLSIIISMVFEKRIEGLSGYNEIGTYLIYLFFFVIGVPASIPMIIKNAPLLFIFTLIIALTMFKNWVVSKLILIQPSFSIYYF